MAPRAPNKKKPKLIGFLGVVAAHRFYLDERTGNAAAMLLLNWIRFGLLLTV
ncbi:NINE protein [Bacillus paralicheniformis]|uniref:NINE protein n=1 Tax=Bacillus paralicheniformis TaxID=1648923 RepID=UPI0028527F14|nr:NINE protein [Bacillus paralicheniformis]